MLGENEEIKNKIKNLRKEQNNLHFNCSIISNYFKTIMRVLIKSKLG